MSNQIPTLLKETLIRSHVDFEKGWPGISFEGYIKVLEDRGIFPVISAVFQRCQIYPEIWQFIDSIFGGWDFPAGHNVSEGFNFMCSNPDAFLAKMRYPTAPFCEDLFNVHGERDSFREIVSSGPGLHVCITQPQARVRVGDDAVPYDIHIDRFQVVCSKLPNGKCNYAVVNSGSAQNMKDHMKEAVPWMLGRARQNIEKRAEEEIEKYKKLL